MKKIIYTLVMMGLMLTSCNPLDDIYSDIDAEQAKQGIIGNFEYTLTEDDYKNPVADGGLALDFANFNTDEDAKNLISGFLKNKYPYFGATYKSDGTIDEASTALVTYGLYNRINKYSAAIYVVLSSEYEPITGNTFGNFSSAAHLTAYLNSKYPDAESGDFVSLRYKYYSGSVNTLTNGFVYSGTSWTQITGFTEDEYDGMGESFPNFSSESEAEEKIPAFLNTEKGDAETGELLSVMYELYSSGTTTSYTINYTFNGTEWIEYNNVQTKTLQFAYDGTSWVPDNTIKYTLVSSDYPLIVSALSGKYPAATGSMDNYGNFERRAGNAAEWTNEMIAEAMNAVLNNLVPAAEEGQKYTVNFDVYNGSNGTENIGVIKTGGTWVLQ